MKGSNILIIGSSSGIGAAARERLLSEGASVFGVDIKPCADVENYRHFTADIRREAELN